MSDKLYEQIPSLDLSDFTGSDLVARRKFVVDLGSAYQHIGFVAIRNHFLTKELSERLYRVVRFFFELPDEIKQKYVIAGLSGQRGYTGKGKEHAKGRNTGDLKEFYHVGQVADDYGQNPKYPGNVWPEELPEFKEISTEVYQRLEKTGIYILRAIALFLNLPENYFDDRVQGGNSILRPIHYYPIVDTTDVPSDAVRAAEHGDINLITLLMGASADGLQVLRIDGKWIAIRAMTDQLVVNVGDMLERLTNGKLKSTIHRVVNPPRHLMNTPRYSVPFFMHPRSEMSLAVLPSCVNESHPKLWDDITAGEFLNQRLQEIGLKT